MAYADTYNTANDAAIFQPRCYVAAWLVAQDIISDGGASAAPSATGNVVQRIGFAVAATEINFQSQPPVVLA